MHRWIEVARSHCSSKNVINIITYLILYIQILKMGILKFLSTLCLEHFKLRVFIMRSNFPFFLFFIENNIFLYYQLIKKRYRMYYIFFLWSWCNFHRVLSPWGFEKNGMIFWIWVWRFFFYFCFFFVSSAGYLLSVFDY